ncbi:esterase-like activity of phytase family protein (plasmid) [Bacillus megaterium]|nr:esterase-like activity of phytase family protein [Priestia megaterium]
MDRDNLTFEGIAFANDGNSLWVSMEAPLYQDGPVPTTTNGALSRITQYDRKGKLLVQYAYPIDSIPVKPGPGKYADNGASGNFIYK